MIARLWHGWTAPANADAYEALLKSEVFIGIQNRRIAGYRGMQLFRRSLGAEVEFVTVMWFDSLEGQRSQELNQVSEIKRRPRLLCPYSLSHAIMRSE